jgi:CRP-like cAMP-binding protein
MAKHAYHDHLTSVPLFSDLSEDELDEVAQAATQLEFPAGKVLMRQGQTAHEMFVVIDGTLEVTRDGEHIADIGAGGVAGEIALLTHEHRNSTVATKTPASVLHIDGRRFKAVIDDIPQIAAKLLPVIAARMATNIDRDHH